MSKNVVFATMARGRHLGQNESYFRKAGHTWTAKKNSN